MTEHVRRAHSIPLLASGEVTVERGKGIWTNVLARMMALPPAAQTCPVSIQVSVVDGRVRWLRMFGTHKTITYQQGCDSGVREYSGAGYVEFALGWSDSQLDYIQKDIRLLGVSLPKWLAPQIRASLREAEGSWRVAVEVNSARGALICRYTGNIPADANSDLAAPDPG